MEYDFLYAVQDGVATITLNRPEVLNAITLEIYSQLRDLFEELRYDDSVRAVIITGTGRAFCSGGDVHKIIGEVLERDMHGHLEFTRMTGHLVRNMRLLPKPIIAAVNGMAAGAGAVIALASDFRIVADSAKFAFLFTRVGLTGADMGAAFLLPRVIGQGRAMELLMLGDDVDAATADRYGLATRVVPLEQVMPAARELAARLAAGPTYSLGVTKLMVNNEWTMDIHAALEAEAQAQALMMMGEDHRAFYEAFREKRKAEFKGR
ncbi:MAG TPA: enoyl-CoA hydratase family protein [Anaerolineae bacterium]|nr:enoyl-CoA hydratase family protein [Anaerolineae bacterium]